MLYMHENSSPIENWCGGGEHWLISMSSEMLHVWVVLEEQLWVLHPQSEVVFFVEVLVEGAKRFVVFAPLLRLYGRVDQSVDVGRHLVVPSEVNQAVDKLCMWVYMYVCERIIL